MSKQDWKQSQYYQEDFLASHSVQPGSEEARKMTVTSGLRCLELYRRSDPVGSLVRMLLASSHWRSTRCFLTWKESVTPAKRLLFRLVPSMPHTDGTELPLLPTMTANTHGKTRYSQGGKPLSMAYYEKFGTAALSPEFVEWLMGYEQKFTELIPTPRASDWKGAKLGRHWQPNSQTVHVEREARVPKPAVRTSRTHSPWENWPDEPDVGRVAHGVPARVDRLKCLGNAVVPQQFYPIFRVIAELEEQ